MAAQHPAQKRYSRRNLPPAIHDERFSYGACTAHTPYPSKTQARRSLQRHIRDGCWKCRRGMLLRVWKCPYSGGHFHVGHSWPRPSESD